MALKLFTGYHKFEVKVRRKRLFCPEWSGSFSEERSKCIRFRCFKFKRLPCQFFFKFGYVCLHERMHSSCSQILCLRASSSRSSCIVGRILFLFTSYKPLYLFMSLRKDFIFVIFVQTKFYLSF